MTQLFSATAAGGASQSSKARPVAAVAFVVLAIVFVWWQVRTPSSASEVGRAFFSVDDGKTWFADELSRLPPFDVSGKPAVRAYVYRAKDGKSFVGYLQRYTPTAQQSIEQSRRPDPSRKGPVDPALLRDAFTVGREVKRPGDAEWVSGADPQKVARIVSAAGDAAASVEP